MFKRILSYVILWRLALLFFAWIGLSLLPFQDSFPYRQELLVPFGHPLFYSWANFDGVHYLGIAMHGYFADLTQAFFPLFPLLIRFLSQILHHYLLSGLIISHLTFYLGLILLYRLVRFDNSKVTANSTLIFLLLYPVSFFFGSVYSESLFFFLSVLTFYLARQQRFILASVIATLAATTRLVGIALIPFLILEMYQTLSKPSRLSDLRHYLPIFLPILGLVGYMGYLQQQVGDALYFFHSQSGFGAARSGDKLILIYQVIYRYLKMLLTVRQLKVYYTVVHEFFLSLVFIGLALRSFFRLRRSYAVYSFLVLLIPTLTGTFSSMPRYILAAFPLFILLGRLRSRRLKFCLYLGSAILLAVNTILFTRGFWVS